jgi:hypothetical protein
MGYQDSHGFINLLELLTKSRKHVYQFIVEITKDPEEEVHMGERAQSRPFPATSSSGNNQVFSYPGVLQTQSFWVFMETSLHKHDQNMRQSCGNLIGRNGCNSKIID